MPALDPYLVAAIRRIAPRYGLDPNVLAATAFVESGGRLGAIGDGGNSFGPYQFNRRGRLASSGLTPQQAMDPELATEFTAREFATFSRRGYRGPQLAYAAQRPADRASYIAAIQRALQMNLMGTGAATAAGGAEASPSPPPAYGLSRAALSQLARIRQQAERGVAPTTSAIARLRSLRPASVGQATGAVGAATAEAAGGVTGRVLGTTGKLIGTPGVGTHTVGNWESDNAVDMAVPAGTPVYAPTAGVIGPQFGALNSQNPRMAGLRLHLSGPGQEFYLAHLSRFAPGIAPGVRVRAGQLLGFTGAANGVEHLHAAVRTGDPRRYQW